MRSSYANRLCPGFLEAHNSRRLLDATDDRIYLRSSVGRFRPGLAALLLAGKPDNRFVLDFS